MKNSTKTLFSIFALATSLSAAANGNLSANLLVTAKMNGMQETPAVTTNAMGLASFSLNATHDTLCVNVSLNGLSGQASGVHLHKGASGISGPVVLDLSSFIVGNRISTSITGGSLTPSLVSELLNGSLYINAHTLANPNGEIRGQLWLETDSQFASVVNGAQETPAVVTSAYALGVFNLSEHGGMLQFHIVASGLSGAITGAHLHTGSMGASGAVAVDLSSNVSGNVITGSIDTSMIANSAMFLNNLKMGLIYFNIHTAANPNGEIRGQLMMDNNLAFDANLNGMQETPSVINSADAIASFKVNTTFDTLWYNVVAAGLSGQMNGIHVHTGNVGMSGGVAIDLSNTISGNQSMGMITGGSLTMAVVNSMLSGGTYINIHTVANPNGEIRGQVYRLAREGCVISLDGMQETPSVTTTAKGCGIVSIDRYQMDAHFMYVCSGLSGTANGVHFHSGAMGMSGGVAYDLTAMSILSGSNASGWGYLKSTDASPFTMANSMKMLHDSVYINLHTVANPNGEMRGQVERGAVCFTTLTGIEEQTLPTNFGIYPNPVHDYATINLSSSNESSVHVLVYNVLGKEMQNHIAPLTKGNNLLQIDLSGLDNGVYFIRLVNENASVTGKIIKN